MRKSCKVKEKVLWAIDMTRNEFEQDCKNPLCTIVQRGPYFSVLYHGCCEVSTAFTLEAAKQYVKESILRRKF